MNWVYKPFWGRASDEYCIGFVLFFAWDFRDSKNGISAIIDADLKESKNQVLISLVKYCWYLLLSVVFLAGMFCSYFYFEYVPGFPYSSESFYKVYYPLCFPCVAVFVAVLAWFGLLDVCSPWTAFLSNPIFYTIAQLSYTGYLWTLTSSFFIAYWLPVDFIDNMNVWHYTLYYFIFLVYNLSLAFVVSVLIERPFMKLA